MTKLAVFDFDSTLLNGESINLVLEQILADPIEKQKLESIQKQGMLGDLALQTSLEQRIIFFKNLRLNTLNQICQTLPWTTGAKETITTLKDKGYLTVCLSGGFRTATRRVITELGVDAYCCNTLEVNNDKLTGKISGSLRHHDSKGILLQKIQQALSVTPQDTVVVGDGANDLSMFSYANTSIAFCAQDALKQQASHVVNSKDLSKILRCID